MTDELIAGARAGDADAFQALIEPYRRELQVHGYRMLGSVQDAEDMLQDTLLAAWQGLGAFEGRSSIRTWLYRIATNRCLNALRSTKRRSPKTWDLRDVDPPEPSRLNDVVWLEPYPDARLEPASGLSLGPEARYQQTEAISLAFITALQILPGRQRAVLILRDVLGYRASEVADMLNASVESINSSLKRARASLRSQQVSKRDRQAAPAADSAAERALVAKFIGAWESGDVDRLVDLFTADVSITMPPMALEYHGREAAARFFAVLLRYRSHHLVATRANGQPALGAYLRAPVDGRRRATGLFVLTLAGDRICGMTHFESSVLRWFGLPDSLPD